MEKAKKPFLKKLLIVGIVIALVGTIWLIKSQTQMSENNASLSINETKGYFPLDATEQIDLKKLTSYGLPIIIDFGADNCAPCVEMAPALKTLNEEFSGQAIVLFVDVFKYQQAVEGFPIQLIPTQIFIDADGNPYQPSVDTVEYIQYKNKNTGELAFTAHQGTITEEQLREILSDMGVRNND